MKEFDRITRVLALSALISGIAACGDDPAGPRQPGPPSQLTVVSGADQQAVVGAQLPLPITVRVADSAGVVLRGVAVEFAVTSGGGSSGGAVVTDSMGLATTTWILGTSTAQPQRLRVRVIHPAAQPELTVSARATAGAAANAAPGTGDAQTGDLGQQLANPLSVVVTDRFGNPVAGVPVAWVVTSGGGAVSTSVQPTDSTGTSSVRWTLGSRLDTPQRVTAQAAVGSGITFTATPRLPASARLTALAGAPTTGTVGRELSAPFQVLLTLANGTPVEGADVTWSVVSGVATVSPATTRTDAQGRAVARLTLGNTPGPVVLAANVAGLPEVRFNVTGTADVPATVTIVSGNNQSQPISSLLPLPLTVSVTDRFGNLLPGVTVIWSVTTGGGTVTPGTSITDAAGRATTSWRLGNVAGVQTVSASVPGAVGVSFNATAQAGTVVLLTLSPRTINLAPGGSAQITAAMRDQFGNTVTGRNPVWTTSDTLVARVSTTGLVTAISDGAATIRATIDGAFDSVTVSVVTPPAIPATPTPVEAVAQSSSQIQFNWQLNSSNATRLQVEYRQAGTSNWFDLPPIPGHFTGLLVDGLQASTTYEFRVAACNSLGCSPFTTPIQGTTTADLTVAVLPLGASRAGALR